MMIAVPVSWHIGSNTASRDVGVLEEIIGDELVVVGGLRIVEDRAQLLEMRGPQQVVDVGERGLGERAQRLAGHHDDLLAHDFLHAHPIGGNLAVGR